MATDLGEGKSYHLSIPVLSIIAVPAETFDYRAACPPKPDMILLDVHQTEMINSKPILFADNFFHPDFFPDTLEEAVFKIGDHHK